MINDAGKRVDGAITPDNVAWHPVVPLGYAHTYTITINSRGPGGKPGKQSVSFLPSDRPTRRRSRSARLRRPRWPRRHLRRRGRDRRPFRRVDRQQGRGRAALIVTTPRRCGLVVLGRRPERALAPENYYPRHNRHRRGQHLRHPLGDGLFGRRTSTCRSRSATRTSRRRRRHQTGQRLRQRPAGPHHADVDGHGRHRDDRQHHPVVLDSAGRLHRAGQGQPGGHGLFDVRAADQLPPRLQGVHHYATRISIDGIYLHQLDATVWAQGNTDTSTAA